MERLELNINQNESKVFTCEITNLKKIESNVRKTIEIYDELKELHSKHNGEGWKDCLRKHLQRKHKSLHKAILENALITKANIMKELRKPIEEAVLNNQNLRDDDNE